MNINSLNFLKAIEITKPPTAEGLADARERLAHEKTTLLNRTRFGALSGIAVIIAVIAILVILGVANTTAWKTTFDAFNAPPTVGVVFWLVTSFLVLVLAVVLAVTVLLAVALPVPVVVITPVTAVAVLTLAADLPQGLALGALGLTIVVVFTVISTADLGSKISTINNTLDSLSRLNPTDHPDECIALVEWTKQDATLNAYIDALAKQHRRPVLGEYQAAKQWIESSENRQAKDEKIERAKAACERFT